MEVIFVFVLSQFCGPDSEPGTGCDESGFNNTSHEWPVKIATVDMPIG